MTQFANLPMTEPVPLERQPMRLERRFSHILNVGVLLMRDLLGRWNPIRSSARYSLVVGIALASLGSTLAVAQERADDDKEFFKAKILPILKDHCFECHGGEAKVRGGLVLTNREGLIEGGDSGPAVDIDDASSSLLMESVRYESYEMPPEGKLSDEKIDLLQKWIERGLPYEGDFTAEHNESHSAVPEVNEQSKSFWSFQPVKRPALPEVADSDWVRDDLDRFVLARLESSQLEPASAATKTQWLRRVYYDLIGLPPTPEQVGAFLSDESPKAYETVVDELLDSPHYGEKWGRHWLDLVRYAETNSYERDGAKPHVWRYRDYVIRSFNDDKPYDQFLIEQLAGDELAQPTPETIVATGYYRLGRWDDEPADPELAFYDDMDDVVATTGQVFLGLTVNCSRCHDHKIDPIPQADYYRFLSFFQNVRRYGVRSHESVVEASVREIASAEQKQLQAQEIAEHQTQVQTNLAELKPILEAVQADFQPVEHEEFKHEMNRIPLVKKRVGSILSEEQFDTFLELEKRRRQLARFQPSALDSALCVKENGSQAPPTHILIRGNPHAPGELVDPGFPSVLSPPEPQIDPPAHGQSTGRRLALAQWLTDPSNPLTARVMVNRIWQYHFGRGLVRSSSDFGFQGTPPTHPLLLDYLASEFVAGDWRMKPLHRRIVLSASYRMSSEFNETAYANDPANDLMWRFDPRRLTAEELRDSMLAVNGTLNQDKMFGPSVFTSIPAEVLAGQSRPGAGWGESSLEDRTRRSIYIHVKRSLLDPFLEAFDAADTDNSCPVRFVTTQPTQALALINSGFVNDQAVEYARFLHESSGDREEQIRIGLYRVLQRPPSVAEIHRGRDLITRLMEEYEMTYDEAFEKFCLVALNLNEFMYLD